MSDVQFEEDGQGLNSFKSHTILGAPTTPSMSRWFTKTGIVRNEKQAGYFMYVIITFCIITSAAIVYFNWFYKPIPHNTNQNVKSNYNGGVLRANKNAQ